MRYLRILECMQLPLLNYGLQNCKNPAFSPVLFGRLPTNYVQYTAVLKNLIKYRSVCELSIVCKLTTVSFRITISPEWTEKPLN